MARFGLFVPQDEENLADLRDFAAEAEDLGFHSLWAFDHFYHYPSRQTERVLEPWTLLSVLAGVTRTIRLGSLVLCHDYRPPALVAKMAATLDVLSGGRLEFGYGAGWHAEEFAGYGYDFDPAPQRIERMDEGLSVIRALWAPGRATFEGRHHRVREAICEPRPRQQPHPPITIGGGGERFLLRSVARQADVWNYFPVSLPEYERKAAVLEEHCRAIGRDPATLRRSLTVPLVTAEREKDVRDQLDEARAQGMWWAEWGQFVQGTPDIVVPRLLDYERRGVDLFILQIPRVRDREHLRFIAREILAA